MPTSKDVVKRHKKRLIKQNTKQNNDRHAKVTRLTPTTWELKPFESILFLTMDWLATGLDAYTMLNVHCD